MGAARTPSELVRELGDAFKANDWARVEQLYHPEAVVQTITGGDIPLPGHAFLQILRESEDIHFKMPRWTATDLDANAAFVAGISQRRMEPRGFTTSPVSWVMTFQDDLLYRSAVFPSEREAKEAYARLGIQLGIPKSDIDAALA